jgi:uncharacterized membrane protein YqaE (UPF0057 family)
LVRLLLSVYFCIQPIRCSEINYVVSTPAICVFLYLANQVFGTKIRWFDSCYRCISVFSQSGFRTQNTLFQLLLSLYFYIFPISCSDINYVGSTTAIGIFLYLANQAFGNKLLWLDSSSRCISLFSQSGFRTQTTLVRLLLSVYFCI